MKDDIKNILYKEYSVQTRKASNISRIAVGAIAVTQVYLNGSISNLCIIFFMLEIFQYTYLGLRTELTMYERISITTGNKILLIGNILYWSKIGIALTLLIGEVKW